MKNAVSFCLHLAVALAIALAIALTQYMLWRHFNLGIKSADVSLSIKGFSYNGYRHGKNPNGGPHPTAQEVDEDFALLRMRTDSIRTYGIVDLPDMLPLAGKHDFQVTAGIWIDDNDERNRREIEKLVEAANSMRQVERLIVGNEYIWRGGDRAFARTVAYLDEIRGRTNKPVSTAEQWHVWEAYPELANHVDFITVHIFPYHNGVPIDQAVREVFARYHAMVKLFPGKKVVIGEIGWPSLGPRQGAAVTSPENQARFVRAFLADPETPTLDYFLMEAFDQPWKVSSAVEGWAGPHWGMYYADRDRKEPKFSLEGPVESDPFWREKAIPASIAAFLPMFLSAFFLTGWSIGGRVFLAVLIQLCVTTLVVGINVPVAYDSSFTPRDWYGLTAIIAATCLTVAVLLSHGFEFGEVLFKRRWQRRFMPLPPHAANEQPFVSIHLACHNEPPEMVIATIDSLAVLDYANFEVLILDNNTRDEALWRPLEKRCAELGPRFRFFHLMNWPGFKAGALNYGLKVTDPRAEVVGVVDADYVVDPRWLANLVPHFDKGDVAVVQAPQAHRDWETQPFRRMCNWEFDGFFRIGMHHRNERNALIQHGTMTLVRRLALEEVGGWSEWCICEDTELGLRLIEKGYDTRYVDHVFGRGLTPSDFAAIKSQRFRWAFGAMQILKAHLPRILGKSTLNLAQRYHFLTGWFAWFADAMQLVFAFGSISWTIGILHYPKIFSLPITTLAWPILGFMAFKAILGPVLYHRTMACPWRDILGASILSVGLAHAIARGVFTGLFKKKGVFVVTPKGWKAKGAFAFLGPIREELGILIALVLAIMALVWTRGMAELSNAETIAWIDIVSQGIIGVQALGGGAEPLTWTEIVAKVITKGLADIETRLWIGILALQCIPYMASIACQIAAYIPERCAAAPSSKPESRLLAAP